jgi:tetratricopeptide (TPR) repeat protein
VKAYGRFVLFCLAGLAFFAPLKFGTPVIAQSSLTPPTNWVEWVFFGWPNQLATIFAFGTLLWLVLDRERLAARVDFLFVLPLLFLASQAVAAPASIAPQTTADTLMMFATGVLLFYSAAWYVRDGASAARIFGALGLATVVVLVLALEQRFGGLQRSREYAALYGDMAQAPSDFRLRMTSDRVFGPLVYPNALAGYLVLVFAPMLTWIWARGRTWLPWMRWGTMAFVGALIVFCLVLTGSRGGFLAFAAMVMAGLFCFALKGERRARWVVIALLAVAGIFVAAQRVGLIGLGTSSVEARRDYWRGAIAIARDHPWLGTGPGTFGSIYPKYKTAASEEAQLVHNNFLQMWPDSGVAGFVTFALLWLVALRDALELARRRTGDAAAVAVCAALAGWVVHGLMDFDLYVPGVALPAFLLLGVLQGLKELPQLKPVGAREQTRLAVGTVCVAVVAAVVWMEGRSLAASFANGRTQQLRVVSPAAAMASARRAIELAPRNPHYRAVAGDLAVELGRFDEAIGFYRTAIECDPYRASYHWRLARVLATAGGRADQVIEQLRQAHGLNPTKQRYREDLEAAQESVRQSAPVLLESAPTKQE